MNPQRVLAAGSAVRLRPVEQDEYLAHAAPWYRDADVLDLSEYGAAPYDRDTVRRMFEVTSRKGEVYLIEVRDHGRWRVVGDAMLLEDAVPIVIGDPAYRSRGIGGEVFIGADTADEQGNPGFSAHAWLLCGEVFVTGEAGHARYQPVMSFSWGGSR